jgi:hypothetical protein
MSLKNKIRLSLVVGGRNDNYGETFSQRFQTFLRYLASIDDSLKQKIELIAVDWNSPQDAPSLYEAMDWSGVANVRVVTVPPHIHAEIPNPGNMPMLEFFAKNVGVRRASGDWIVSMNPDIVLSTELLDFAVNGTLDPGCFYRADRYDFRPDAVFTVAGRDIFKRSLAAVFEAHTRPTPDPCEEISRAVEPGSAPDSWPQSCAYFEDKLGPDGDIIECCRRPGRFTGLHTNASGDFVMASRAAWSRVRGHWERTDTFTHLDALLTAHFLGAGYLQQIVLRPHMVLHMDHTREEQKARPRQAIELVVAEIVAAASGDLPNPNGPGWGLGDVALPERSPGGR